MDDPLATPPSAPDALPPEPEKTARWEDYVDVFFSPAELFRRRAHDRVAPPLVTLLILAVVLYFVLLPANGIVMRVSMAENPQALEAMGRWMTLMQVAGSIFVPITYGLTIAAAAALLWLLGRLLDIRSDFKRAALIATYAAYVMLLSQLVVGVLVLLHGEAGLDPVRHLSTGVLRFTGGEDLARPLVALLRRVDVFAIWQAILWGVGVHVVFGASRSRAALVAALTWLLFAIPGIIMGAFRIGPPPA